MSRLAAVALSAALWEGRKVEFRVFTNDLSAVLQPGSAPPAPSAQAMQDQQPYLKMSIYTMQGSLGLNLLPLLEKWLCTGRMGIGGPSIPFH